MQDLGDIPQGTEGMAFIARRFQTADLLLGHFKELREVFLRKSCLATKRGDLERHIPGLTCALEVPPIDIMVDS